MRLYFVIYGDQSVHGVQNDHDVHDDHDDHDVHDVDEIYDLARMSLEEQADNMETLHSLGKGYYGSPQLPHGLDTTEFLEAGQTLAQLRQRYPQPEN
jgi:hypothetical protein